MNNCIGCGSPMKIVPAGVSKIKKDKQGNFGHYSAFEACSNRDCTYKPPRTAQSAPRGAGSPKPINTPPNENTRLLKEILETLKFIHEALTKDIY